MQYQIVKGLINPYNKQPLTLSKEGNNEFLIDSSGNKIPVIEGIPDFLVLEDIQGANLKSRNYYDKLSKFNDIAEFIYPLIYNMKEWRSEWMKDVEVKENWRVLETAVGRGWSFRVLPDNAQYFGVDISRGMLEQAQKNKTKWDMQMELFQGNAEYLPFADQVFDSVFHLGGINYFNDRKRAVEEMIRVAKADTRIVIVEKTAGGIKRQYRHSPAIRTYGAEKEIARSGAIALAELVPANMKDLQIKLLDSGKMYQLSFRTV